MKNIDLIRSLDAMNLAGFVMNTYSQIYEVRGKTNSSLALANWLAKEQYKTCPKCGCSTQFFCCTSDEITYSCPHCGEHIIEKKE